MRDIRATDDDNLAALALLYANGEMDPADAMDFERRLGEDQRVREALCQAVELARTLEGGPPATPNPSYRQAVRLRLQPKGFWRRVAARRPYRGHPALWTALGAAAVLLAISLARLSPPTGPAAGDPVQAALPAATVPPAPAPDPALNDAALAWAEIPKHDHLSRVRQEEQRRKNHRSEEQRIARNEERPNPFLTEPMSNQ